MEETIAYRGKRPVVGEGVFIARGAAVIGDVTLMDQSSVWFACVVRGDVNSIRIGRRSNIQDGTVIHVVGQKFTTEIGDDVTIGHGCILHGCTIGDGALIGMGATVMDGAVVESGAMVAAGALVTPGKIVPRGELWGGSPARFLRRLTDEDRARGEAGVKRYLMLAEDYRDA